MPDFEITIQVAQDRKVMAIELAALGRPSQRLILELNELDRLISELGNARSQMVSEQAQPDLESDETTISTVANAKWCIRVSPPAVALFAFNHPKFGPVGLMLPKDQITKIVSFLTDRFILQPTQSVEKH
ncbi:hypothetical protein [Microvirga mediterraneensis]|uniref:Uncharacterized protein n=1 Tax=Microvirga mediterraneensis TaxID=2754695 RepID=A0A838BHJ6_9HYPH|nr:hypothetical protein [Microvirga mediterraneensis]MBA1155017.1 hypothetical protein [Microvirga mediterraneensis]